MDSNDAFIPKDSYEAIESSGEMLQRLAMAFENKPAPSHNWIEEMAADCGVQGYRTCYVTIDNTLVVIGYDTNAQASPFRSLGQKLVLFDNDISQMSTDQLMTNVRTVGELKLLGDNSVSYKIYENESSDAVVVVERLKAHTENLIDTPSELVETAIDAAHFLHPELDAIDAEAEALQIHMNTLSFHPLEVASEADMALVDVLLAKAAAAPCVCSEDC